MPVQFIKSTYSAPTVILFISMEKIGCCHVRIGILLGVVFLYSVSIDYIIDIK